MSAPEDNGQEHDKIINCMIPATCPEDYALSHRICNDETVYSDSSGMSNKQKWEVVHATFECSEEASLYTDISFEQILELDDPAKCAAGAYIADLRVQLLHKFLNKVPSDPIAHLYYIRNRQWQARFLARVDLSYLQESLRGCRLT